MVSHSLGSCEDLLVTYGWLYNSFLQNSGSLVFRAPHLTGDREPYSRFGYAMANLGDINGDGLEGIFLRRYNTSEHLAKCAMNRATCISSSCTYFLFSSIPPSLPPSQMLLLVHHMALGQGRSSSTQALSAQLSHRVLFRCVLIHLCAYVCRVGLQNQFCLSVCLSVCLLLTK